MAKNHDFATLYRENRIFKEAVEDFKTQVILDALGIDADMLAQAWGPQGLDFRKIMVSEGMRLPAAIARQQERLDTTSPVADIGYAAATSAVANSSDRSYLLAVVVNDDRKTVCARAAERICDLRNPKDAEPDITPAEPVVAEPVVAEKKDPVVEAEPEGKRPEQAAVKAAAKAKSTTAKKARRKKATKSRR